MKKVLSFLLPVALFISIVAPQAKAQTDEIDTVSEIQAAIDQTSSKGGGTVTLPAKTINVDKMIILKSNVHLKGAGTGKTKLVVTNPELTKMLTSDRTTGSELSGITFDARKDLRKHYINSGFYHTMDFAFATDFHVHDIEVVNSVDSGIALWYAENGVIEDSKFTNGGANAILGMQKTHHIDVLNNTIDKTDNQNGIFFMFQGESTHDINIIGNKVKNVADYAIEVGHTTHGEDDAPHRNIVITDNVIDNAYCTGIGLRTVSDAVVENNKINGYAKVESYGCNGIFIEGRVAMQENIKVKNNEIVQIYPDDEDSDPTNYQQAMYITGVKDTEISGNKIVGSHDIGIKVLAAWFGGQTKDFQNGVRLYRSVNIHDNEILDSQYYGIYMDGHASSDSQVKNNTVRGFGTKGILIEGKGVQQSGNIEEKGDSPQPVEPIAPENNLWTNPTTMTLQPGFPSNQRLMIEPGEYTISFDLESTSGASKLNLYYEDRGKLNQYLDATKTKQSHSFKFTTTGTHNFYFYAQNGATDIKVSNIKLTKKGEEVVNYWEKSTEINPLTGAYPDTQRQQLGSGKYKVTFKGKSVSGKSVMNLYYEDRRVIDKTETLGTEFKTYSYEFTVKDQYELFFLALNGASDIHIKDISIVKVN